MLPPRYLLVALVVCAILYFASRAEPRLGPAYPAIPARIEGQFTEGSGWFPGEPLVTARPVRAWGSWTGSDANTGQLVLGPFRARDRVSFAVSGYPTRGIELSLERVATHERRRIDVSDVGERWRVVDHLLPPTWRDEPVLLVATDRGQSLGGWVGVTEPMQGGRGAGSLPLWTTLASWAVNGVALGVLWLAAAAVLARSPAVSAAWQPLAAFAAVAFAGYVTFWACFAHPMLGRVAAFALLAAAVAVLWRRRHAALPSEVVGAVHDVARLAVVVGCFYLALLHLFPSSLDLFSLAANRFRVALPADNFLTFATAERLLRGDNPRASIGDWLSSDRPPLQTGWQLLTLPLTSALGLEPQAAGATAAVCFQLAWIAAAYGLLRRLGLDRRRTCGWIAVLALSGFFLQNSIFTWPKLSAAAFACGAFAGWVFPPPGARRMTATLAGAVLAALAWLSHGGVAFSFIVLLPWVAWRCLRGEARHWLSAAAVFLLLGAPWLAYQKFYDPPGNRLLKWHLGGQISVDPRGTVQTLRENYAALPASEILAHKRANFSTQLAGNWTRLFDFSVAGADDRRTDEFFHTARAFTWWSLALLALPVAAFRRSSASRRPQFALALWVALTLPVWCLLMFLPGSAIVHQGSYAVMLSGFILASACLESATRWSLPVLAALQAATFLTTWLPASPVVGGYPDPFAAAGALAGGLALAAFVVAAARRSPDAAPAPSSPASA